MISNINREIVSNEVPKVPFVLEYGTSMFLVYRDGTGDCFKLIKLDDSNGAMDQGSGYSDEYESIEDLIEDFDGTVTVSDIDISLVNTRNVSV